LRRDGDENSFITPLPHKCGVPVLFGTPHLCGSEEFCRAPDNAVLHLSRLASMIEIPEAVGTNYGR
jgi:hypothetical protein